jgi:hypothetical protein
MEVLQLAIQQGADVDKLAKLLELQERWEANQARKAFNEAFGRFKAEAVRVVRNVTVTDGPLKGKKHVDLFGAVSAITPALSKYGLSHSWRLTRDEPTWMEVTCTIRHDLGHSESVSMGAAPDTGPGRNAIQARGSAKTYLERYTLLAATGLAAAGQDDDGRASEPREAMPEESVMDWLNAIASAADLDELKKQYFDAAKKAETFHDTAAVAKFQKAKNERYRQLKGGSHA